MLGISAWDVVYCSVPTSPGGGYRSAVGRIFFKTKEMIQAVEAPDTIKNKVSFSALGFLDGQVSLTGKTSNSLCEKKNLSPPLVNISENQINGWNIADIAS